MILILKNFNFLSLDTFVDKLLSGILSFTPRVLAAIVIWILGSFIIKWSYITVKKVLESKGFDPSVESFLLSFLKIGLRLFLFGFIIGVLGVQTTSVAALMAGLGVAIGSAFNGSLGNFAGGIMIILYKPFKVGEFIEFGAEKGTVQALGIFNTTILTGDYKTIFLPNGMLSTGMVINWSRHGFLRVDVPMSIDAAIEIEKVKQVAIHAMQTHPKILKTPSPEVVILNINAGSIQISLRPYCTVEDYWVVFNDIHTLVIQAFIDNGIQQGIPKQILISK